MNSKCSNSTSVRLRVVRVSITIIRLDRVSGVDVLALLVLRSDSSNKRDNSKGDIVSKSESESKS